MSTIDGGWRGPNIVKDGLVLYLDAGSPNSYYGGVGTTWKDMSSNGNNGTLTNGPTFNSSNGGSIVFDGVNDVGTISPTNIINQINNEASVQITLKFNTTFAGGFGVIFLNRNNNDALTTLGITFDDRAVVRPWNPSGVSNNRALIGWSGGGNFSNYTSRTGSMLMNEWVIITLTTSTSSINLYYNGVLSMTTPFLGTLQKPNVNFRIANQYSVGVNDQPSPMSNSSILLYNRALTAQEVSQNFNATRARFGI